MNSTESEDASPATKGDLKRLEISTKEDINRLEISTKEDIKRLEISTKEDIQRLAISTKEDIQRLETSVERRFNGVDEKINGLALAVVDLQGNVRKIEDKMDGLATKKDISKFVRYAEKMLAKGEKYDKKADSHGDMIMDIETKVQDHGRRIARLETGPAPGASSGL